MATIIAKNDISTLKIKSFLGLNENPDGDTVLKVGEMAALRNFRITQDNHLQKRPGTRAALRLYDSLADIGLENIPEKQETHTHGAWRGSAGGKKHFIVAYDGYIFDIDTKTGAAVFKGTAEKAETHFFAFGGKVYMLNGHEYKSWDGGDNSQFVAVEGYVPLVKTASSPDGADGVLLEGVNRLTGKRRVEFSPDGTTTVFRLPEQDITDVYSVMENGQAVTEYAIDKASGTVTFATAPAHGTNTVEIGYAKGTGTPSDVTNMRFSELFNGETDTRVFLYGDGTNKTIYSGVRYDTGEPSAEYFPDLYEAAVGESNTPITALVRHYSRMMAFKPDSAWVITPGTITLESNELVNAYYVQPVNRQFGNDAPGQVKLLENNPITLDVGSAYQWRSTTNGSGYISGNENNAKRISDRVGVTLKSFDFTKTRTANIKYDHEFWIMADEKAVILNYANDAWYVYCDLPFNRIIEADGEKYGISEHGDILHFSRLYRSDDTGEVIPDENGEEKPVLVPINCLAESGAIDFDRDWLLKYSPMLFVAMQPESGARIQVTVQTNRRSQYPEKTVSYNLSTFSHVDFKHFSFATNRKPQVRRVKLKVKKATYYRLVFKSESASATGTVIETDVQLRYSGNVK